MKAWSGAELRRDDVDEESNDSVRTYGRERPPSTVLSLIRMSIEVCRIALSRPDLLGVAFI